MKRGHDKKLRWFRRGAADLARVFPNLSVQAAEDSGVVPSKGTEFYACPLCAERLGSGRVHITVFVERALETGALTFEDVPPRSFGGRPFVLTCKRCNDRAGFGIDAAARSFENPRDALAGVISRPVHIREGEHVVTGTVSGGPEALKLDLLPAKHQRPGALEALNQRLPSLPTLELNFYRDHADARLASISWLKSAYLVAFGIFGCGYAFLPTLDIVRTQIRQPEQPHIPRFLMDVESATPSDRIFHRVTEPQWLACLAVQIGRRLVFLPHSTDGELYRRIADAPRGTIQVNSIRFTWPSQPPFGAVESLTGG